MKSIIEVENISKQYRLGLVGTGTLSHDFNRWWQTSILGKEDPYLKIGEANDRTVKGSSDYVWALKDINFMVQPGEVLGIIGKNGAGKSTLLKLLSRVTAPTTGRITAYGRIASLLEVGTGFHPELTGRENIFLNGAILGMSKSEVASKFDEIVDFAGCERYIDTPVKRYSSGMYVRLAFAVAAHLEPEILVVDEVLAVGDAEFQKKAIGKMKDVSQGQGRTVLFVSHNMASVKSLCTRGIVLGNGSITLEGHINDCVSYYLKGNSKVKNHKKWTDHFDLVNNDFELHEIGIKAVDKSYEDTISMKDPIEFVVLFKQKTNRIQIDITVHFKDDQGQIIFSGGTFQSSSLTNLKETGFYEVKALIPANFFNSGNFSIDLYVVENLKKSFIREMDVLSFTVINEGIELGRYMGSEPGAIHPLFEWNKKILKHKN